MSKKRTTAEEKRQLLLSLFKETEDVYQLRELEKVASKEKGVPMNTVKDTLQQLVDDDQVETAKIGNQTYYWLFKSKATKDKQTELEELIKKIETKEAYLKELEDKLGKIDAGDFEDTEEKQKTLEELKERYKEIEKQLDQNNQEGDIVKTVNELNDWTDNLFLIRKYVQNNMKMDPKQLDKEFGIPKDMEYI